MEARAGEDRRIVVVMPAYNAERTLQRTYDELPHDIVDNVILVDDASEDSTVALARQLNLKVVVHRRNKGYGANQKTCYLEALKDGATIIVMVHPDYQYDPKLLPDIIAPIENGLADVVLGSRMMGTSAYRQGMPWWKYVGNRLLTNLENAVFGMDLSEYHTGYRAYSREVLERLEFTDNSNGFIFDQEIIAQIVESKYRIAEVPVPVRYFAEASSVGFVGSLIYGLGILNVLWRYLWRNRNVGRRAWNGLRR